MIEFNCATRDDAAGFRRSLLARWLSTMATRLDFTAHVALGNSRGLPLVYNERIEAGDDASILVFLHDDVWLRLDDLDTQLEAGLAAYDVVGVAGTTRRRSGAVTWAFRTTPPELQFDQPYLSGEIAHISGDKHLLTQYGPWPRRCALLDGVFLAARRGTLRRSGVRFDPRFSFHLYDLDFCRTAEAAGLTLGTWPIALSHASHGSFGAGWSAASAIYLEKWGE